MKWIRELTQIFRRVEESAESEAGWKARVEEAREMRDQALTMAEEQRERANKLEGRLHEVMGERCEPEYFRRPGIVMETEAGRARKDLERLLVLAGMGEQDPLWQVVLSYADEHEQTERELALGPGLADGQRQYNAGRAASAYDFATALRELRVKAEAEGRKLKS